MGVMLDYNLAVALISPSNELFQPLAKCYIQKGLVFLYQACPHVSTFCVSDGTEVTVQNEIPGLPFHIYTLEVIKYWWCHRSENETGCSLY